MMSFTLKDVSGQDVGHRGLSSIHIYWGENLGVWYYVLERLEYL